MSSLFPCLCEAIAARDEVAVREFCNRNDCPNYSWWLKNRADPMHISLMAMEALNPDYPDLEIFQIVLEWTQKNGIIFLFHHAISLNQLPIVQYLFPLVKNMLLEFDRLSSLEDAAEPGFEVLHAWLETAFYPQIAFDRWQLEWGLHLELLFTQPALHEMEAEFNALRAAGKIDEDGYPITNHHGHKRY
jgi:hypothetical protein